MCVCVWCFVLFTEFCFHLEFCLQEWYVALVKSQCCLRGDVSLLETTELLTKLPPADLFNIMSCKVTQTAMSRYQCWGLNIFKHINLLKLELIAQLGPISNFTGVQPKPAVSMPEYGSAAVSTWSGVTLVGDGLAGDPGAACSGHQVTSSPTPVFSSDLPATVLLGSTK